MDNTKYEQMIFCSNTLINVEELILVNNFSPLIINKGNDGTPLITLQVIEGDNSFKIVDNNISKHQFAEINNSKVQKVIEINLKTNTEFQKMLSINYSSTPIIVDFIDLRSMGFNITGDSKELKVGNAIFSESTFQSKVFISTST